MNLHKRKRGMVLAILLIVLLFGSLLAGLAMTEVESTHNVSQEHIDQLLETNAGLSALERGKSWLASFLSEKGQIPRWLDGIPTEDGLLDGEEWAKEGAKRLDVYSEGQTIGTMSVSLDILDLDFRLSPALEQEENVPPCLFDSFSLSGGTETVTPETENRLSALNDILLSEDMGLTVRDGNATLSGNGTATVLFEEDSQGLPLSAENGEIVAVFTLSGRDGDFPDTLDLGFRLARSTGHPDEAFRSGYAVSFCVNDAKNSDIHDCLLLERTVPDGNDSNKEILARIPFPFCRSGNSFLQERYLDYLSATHEIHLSFQGNHVKATLDAGKGDLSRQLDTNIDTPPFTESLSGQVGLRLCSSHSGASLALPTLRIHPTDNQGYFTECRGRGFYLLKAVVKKGARERTFETLISADLPTRKLEVLGWQELAFF